MRAKSRYNGRQAAGGGGAGEMVNLQVPEKMRRQQAV